MYDMYENLDKQVTYYLLMWRYNILSINYMYDDNDILFLLSPKQSQYIWAIGVLIFQYCVIIYERFN